MNLAHARDIAKGPLRRWNATQLPEPLLNRIDEIIGIQKPGAPMVLNGEVREAIPVNTELYRLDRLISTGEPIQEEI